MTWLASAWEWTNSRLTALQDCGEYFRRLYIEADAAPGTLRMHRGSAIHAVAREAHLRQKAAVEADPGRPLFAALRESLPSKEEAQDLAATAFMQFTGEGVAYTADEQCEAEKALGAAKDFAVDVASRYVQTVAPTMNPVAVERQITVRPKDSDLVIRGTLDLVTLEPPRIYDFTEGEEGVRRRVVRDLKSSTKSPVKTAADTSQQLTFYAMVDGAEQGKLPDALVLDYLVRTPKRQWFNHVPLTTTRTADDIAALVNRLNTAVEAAEKGVFVPATPGLSWRCSPKWCPFWKTCKYVNGGTK
jgi:hypothetical protein